MNKIQLFLLNCCLPLLLLFSGMAHTENNNSGPQPVEAIPLYGDTSEQGIVGGSESPVGARPYQVQLRQNGQHWCGAALLNQQWVLTAAHCLIDSDGTTEFTGLTVRVGVRDTSNSNEGQIINIAEKIPHTSFTGNTEGGFDIALLKLASNAPANITPIKLPTQSIMDTAGTPGSIVTASGWGALSQGGGGPSIMHEVDLPIVSQQVCNSSSSYNGQIKDDMICAGYAAGGQDSCQGDSGGPLAAEVDGSFYSMGIVSWGDGCALPNKYGIYARTFSFISWINSHMGGGSSSGGSSSGGSSSGGSSSGGSSSGGLSNGQTITGLSAAANQRTANYYIDVPAGATNLSIKIAAGTGSTGDADLFVKKGSIPTDSSYDCRPWDNGSNETCGSGGDTLATSAGRFHINLRAYSTFTNVTLTASYTAGGSSSGGSSSGGSSSGGSSSGGSSSGGLSNGQTITGLSAAANQRTANYYIDVPTGATNLSIKIAAGTGSTGDADLFVKKGSVPTDSSYDCRPWIGGSAETCGTGGTALATSAGRFHINLRAYSAFTNVTLTASYTAGGSSSGGSSSGGSSSGGSSSGGSSSGGSSSGGLSNGQTITGLSAAANQRTANYYIDVPVGASNLSIKIVPGAGSTGDADLFVKKDSVPTDSSYDCRPWDNGSTETCGTGGDTLATSAGRFHINLRAYSAFTNVNLTASYDQ